MKHSLKIGLAATALLALTIGTTAPAEASHGLGFGFGFGIHNGYGFHNGFGIHRGYGFRNCGWRTVKVRRHHRWILVQRRICW